MSTLRNPEAPTRRPFPSLVGRVFNMLTVLREVGRANRKRVWECRCECGRTTFVRTNHLSNGHTRSCGCLRFKPSVEAFALGNKAISESKTTFRPTVKKYKEAPGQLYLAFRTHGFSITKKSADGHTLFVPIYSTWLGIKSRCLNPLQPCYRRYGGSGVTLCDRWRTSFEAFLKDMGAQPEKDSTIDRIDPLRGYWPANCKWIPRADNARKQIPNCPVTIGGVTLSMKTLARRYNIPRLIFHKRLVTGWTGEKLLLPWDATRPPSEIIANLIADGLMQPGDAPLEAPTAAARMSKTTGSEVIPALPS